MENTDQVRLNSPDGKSVRLEVAPPEAWAPQKTRDNKIRTEKPVESPPTGENGSSLARTHACRASLRNYEIEREHLRRADRDLAETAAFIAGSLTTVTAVQAVISMAKEELSGAILRFGVHVYVAVFILILVSGAIRVRSALRKRARAEQEIDQAKKGIFEFCPVDQLPRSDE
jgi:hypothetical protein